MYGHFINLITTKLAPTPHENSSTDETLEFKVEDNDILAKLCGPLESHIAHLEIAFDTQLIRRGNTIFISNATRQQTIINEILKFLHCEIVSGKRIEFSDVDIAIKYFCLMQSLFVLLVSVHDGYRLFAILSLVISLHSTLSTSSTSPLPPLTWM